MRKKQRIIIDTNLWISFLLTKQFAFLDELIVRNKVQLIFSEELLTEFLEVVKRPKLQLYFKDEDIEAVLEIIEQKADFITVSSIVDICRDEKDNFLLSLAKDGIANY
jgi:putative PIN family toxin of toxin-antitoxin system